MPTTTRTFRVFVSSTFEDLRAERNILQEKVFPELERFCLEKGARFQAIDLRWGVREEAGLDQKTMEICLAEIARCQKTGIKPNFIVLLGNRYGWRPLPARIQQDEFESVLAHIANTGERDFVASWYDLDLNAVPSEYLLKPRKGTYTDWGEWEPVELRLHRALGEGARAAGLSPQSLIKYEASATHQEILKGLGETPEDRAHVFAFFRESGGNEDPDLTKLKDHLKAVLPAENVFPWSAGDHARLCDDVERSLKTIVGVTAAQFETQSEKVSHDRFAEDRARHFKGRDTVLDAIEQYLLGGDRGPLVVMGPSGSGKSAIMAVASEGKNAIRRFIGATPESSSGITLLRSLCREFGERFGQTGDLPATFNELSAVFAERLKLAAVEQPVILFIDALDQLSEQDPAAAMRWLPGELPPYCHVVLSTTQIPEALRRAAMVTVKPLPVDEASRALDAWLTEASRTLQPEQREKLLASFLQSGLPLYLKLAFEEARLWRSFDPPGECVLGDGLPGIIDRLFARLSDRANHGEILVSHALGYLTAARYGLTEDEILAVLTKDDVVWNDVLGSGERQRHDPSLRQLPVIVWSRLFLDLEPYFKERTVPGGTTVSFYHRQLAEQVEATPLHHNALAKHFAGQSHWLSAVLPNRRRLTELVRQQLHAGLLDDAAAVLADLDFVEAKCAAELVFDLEEDYREAIAALPEAQEELLEEERRQVEIVRWTQTLVECAEQKRSLKPEEIIKSAEPWSHERIAAETIRITENPTRLDRLKAFAGFVERELYPLNEFAMWPGFVAQQAINGAPAGPVHSDAVLRLASVSVPFLARRWTTKDRYIATPATLRTLDGHGRHVLSLNISPDGRRVLSAGERDSTVRVWDLETGISKEFHGHIGQVLSATPDLGRAVSGNLDGTLQLWNLDTGERTEIQGNTGWITSLNISPDGRQAVSVNRDGTLLLWNLQTGACTAVIREQRNICIAPNGLWAFAVGHDNVLRVWNLETIDCAVLDKQTGWFRCVTPDGRKALSQNADGSLQILNLETGGATALSRSANSFTTSVTISADGRRAVCGHSDGLVRVWDLEMGESKVFQGHTRWIESVSVTPDGRRAISGSWDHTLRVWDLETGNGKSLYGHTDRVRLVSMTPDGRRAVSGSQDGTLRVWNLATGESEVPRGHASWVMSVSVTPDGHRVVSASRDNVLRVWNLYTGESTALSGRAEGGACVALDGRWALAGTEDKALRVWNLRAWNLVTGENKALSGRSGRVKRSIDKVLALLLTHSASPLSWLHLPSLLRGHTGPVSCVSLTPDSQFAVSGSSWDHNLRLWNLETEHCAVIRGHRGPVLSVIVTPDGRHVLSGSGDTTMRLWDLRRRACVRIFEGHTEQVSAVSVTQDGRCAVSGSFDGTIRVWNLGTGESREFLGHPSGVCSVGVTLGGKYAVSGGFDDTLRLWNLVSGESEAVAWLAARPQALAITPDRGLVVGTSAGEVLYFNIHGIVSGPSGGNTDG